jgi:hypothetical protein
MEPAWSPVWEGIKANDPSAESRVDFFGAISNEIVAEDDGRKTMAERSLDLLDLLGSRLWNIARHELVPSNRIRKGRKFT